MLGFMLAALAVLVSVANTKLLGTMQKTGHYDDLVRTIFIGCALFLAIALMGFALLFGVKLHPALEASLVGLHGAALVSLIDIGRKFRLVLKNLSSP